MTENNERQFIVRSKSGNPFGVFHDAAEASRWASARWPDQEQGDDGWDIEVLFRPGDLDGVTPRGAAGRE